MIKGIVIGFLLAIALAAGGVYFYFGSGRAPAAVADAPMPFERKLSHMALNAHIDAQNRKDPQVPADERNLLEGAEVYTQNCASCHGLPDQPPSPYERTMFPRPTPLFRGKGVTDDPPAESYWKVENGIRLSGMPSFSSRLTETQMWQVSQLVANANALPASVKAQLVPVLSTPEPAVTVGRKAK